MSRLRCTVSGFRKGFVVLSLMAGLLTLPFFVPAALATEDTDSSIIYGVRAFPYELTGGNQELIFTDRSGKGQDITVEIYYGNGTLWGTETVTLQAFETVTVLPKDTAVNGGWDLLQTVEAGPGTAIGVDNPYGMIAYGEGRFTLIAANDRQPTGGSNISAIWPGMFQSEHWLGMYNYNSGTKCNEISSEDHIFIFNPHGNPTDITIDVFRGDTRPSGSNGDALSTRTITLAKYQTRKIFLQCDPNQAPTGDDWNWIDPAYKNLGVRLSSRKSVGSTPQGVSVSVMTMNGSSWNATSFTTHNTSTGNYQPWSTECNAPGYGWTETLSMDANSSARVTNPNSYAIDVRQTIYPADGTASGNSAVAGRYYDMGLTTIPPHGTVELPFLTGDDWDSHLKNEGISSNCGSDNLACYNSRFLIATGPFHAHVSYNNQIDLPSSLATDWWWGTSGQVTQHVFIANPQSSSIDLKAEAWDFVPNTVTATGIWYNGDTVTGNGAVWLNYTSDEGPSFDSSDIAEDSTFHFFSDRSFFLHLQETNNTPDVLPQDCGRSQRRESTIGNYVWLDENSDGYQDAGEPGIANVTVDLIWDKNGDGIKQSNEPVFASTVTDADGGYMFHNVPVGSLLVDVVESTLPAGMTQTPPSTLPNADFGNQDQGIDGYQVNIGVGDENLTADFGFNWNPADDVNNGTNTGSIGDRIWIDTDGDGAQDPNEIGVEGVTVQIFTAGPDGIFGTVDDVPGATAISDANGNYIFDGLAADAYVIKVISDTGASHPVLGGDYQQTGDPDHFATGGGINDNQTTTPVVLAPGDVFINADFGYQPKPATTPITGTIGDTVWFDADGDGNYDPNGNDGDVDTTFDNEYGLPGVTVSLIKDSNGNGQWDAYEPIIATDITDVDGEYEFTGLPLDDGGGDADYLVWVNDTGHVLDELTASYDADGTGPAAGLITGLGISATSLSAGTPVDNDQDFGYTHSEHTPNDGLIGDTIFLDLNRNRKPDPGEGIEGVVVYLLNSDGTAIIDTAMTNEDGKYYLGNVDASLTGNTYTVQVNVNTLPAGLTNIFDPDGGFDSESLVTLDSTAPINLDQDFGYRPEADEGQTVGSIGNLIWNDLDADGLYEPNGLDGISGTADDELGYDGVTIDLYYDSNGNGVIDPGEPLVGTTSTAPDGSYIFDNLPTDDNGVGPAGADYVVKVTDRLGILVGHWHSLGTSGSDNHSQIDPYAVTITASAPNNLTADFGYYVKPAALGNRVWFDENENGIQDTGELGIEEIQIKLEITYPDGTIVTIVTTTDADGSYSFGNLLLDEDYPIGSDPLAPDSTLPTYEISVVASSVPPGLGETTTGQGPGEDDDYKTDSDNHSGVTGVPVQGETDVTLNADNPAQERDAASYDFGFIIVPTAVTIGKVDLQVLSAADFLGGLGIEQMDVATLQAILEVWDPELAASVAGAGRETLLAALQQYLDPDGDGQVAALRWDTLEERGTIGFYVDRRVGEEGAWTRINNDMLPGLITAPMGGEYQLVDPAATSGNTYHYQLIEQEARGNTRIYGPYTVEMP